MKHLYQYAGTLAEIQVQMLHPYTFRVTDVINRPRELNGGKGAKQQGPDRFALRLSGIKI
jgi:hypothetical protein